MARRILNRRQLREAAEAAERRAAEKERDEEEEEDEEEEDVEEESEAEVEDELEEEEEKPKKKTRKKTSTGTSARQKQRAAKTARVKVVWGVFSNNQTLEKTFEYPQKAEAEKYAAKLSAEKKTTYYVNPVRQPMT